jgi:hypothetical protein
MGMSTRLGCAIGLLSKPNHCWVSLPTSRENVKGRYRQQAQLGHDAPLTLSTYGHVIDELEDAPRAQAEDAIREGRRSWCVTGVPESPADGVVG